MPPFVDTPVPPVPRTPPVAGVPPEEFEDDPPAPPLEVPVVPPVRRVVEAPEPALAPPVLGLPPVPRVKRKII